MKKVSSYIVIVFMLFSVLSCKKYYEEGPYISFRTKMNRITGTWKLVEMEGVDRLNPHIDQYIELTKEKIDDENYKARFTNFQGEYCVGDTLATTALFDVEVYWKFKGGDWACYGAEENYLYDKQAIVFEFYDNTINEGPYRPGFRARWKILRLTNKELLLENNTCTLEILGYTDCEREVNKKVKLTFEKI